MKKVDFSTWVLYCYPMIGFTAKISNVSDCRDIKEQVPERALVVAILYDAINIFLYPMNNMKGGKQGTIEKRHRDYKFAGQFIFDDKYLIDWGDWVISPRDILEMVDLDINIIRGLVRRKKKEVGYGSIPPNRLRDSLLGKVGDGCRTRSQSKHNNLKGFI